MDEHYIGRADDSSDYIVRNMLKDSRFDVAVSTEPDVNLAKDYEVVMCRFDIPLKEEFLESLAKYDDGSRLFINPPLSKLDYSDKRYLSLFQESDILPETYIGNDNRELALFIKSVRDSGRDLVSKPIDGNGGKGIYKLVREGEDSSEREILSIGRKSFGELEILANGLTGEDNRDIVLQEYVPGIERHGDTRVNVLFYNPVNALLRLPAEGGYKCNISSGGRVVATELVDRDYQILDEIMPFIKDRGAVWAGVDIFGSDSGRYLGEINFPSPGALYETDCVHGSTEGLDSILEGINDWSPDGN